MSWAFPNRGCGPIVAPTIAALVKHCLTGWLLRTSKITGNKTFPESRSADVTESAPVQSSLAADLTYGASTVEATTRGSCSRSKGPPLIQHGLQVWEGTKPLNDGSSCDSRTDDLGNLDRDVLDTGLCVLWCGEYERKER